MLKKVIAGLLTVVFSCMLYAAPKNWHTDYDAALKLAAKSKKPLLVLFTGSDWCPGCIKLNKDTLSNKKFQNYAKKNLILVYMDSPRRKPVSAEARAAMMKLYRQLKPGNYIPATVILSSDGKVLKRHTGFLPADEYIKMIKAAVK